MSQNSRHLALSLIPAAILVGGCAPQPAATSNPAPVTLPATIGSNPFFVESSLPYHAPRFDLITNEDYRVALEGE